MSHFLILVVLAQTSYKFSLSQHRDWWDFGASDGSENRWDAAFLVNCGALAVATRALYELFYAPR